MISVAVDESSISAVPFGCPFAPLQMNREWNVEVVDEAALVYDRGDDRAGADGVDRMPRGVSSLAMVRPNERSAALVEP